ncbi:MAG: hypothetical protein F6J92_35555 [Symploca sp. SIO1A3]|nr:hypothetical protein [Symploca sp. SIO2C1]NER51869.1 hypothetical protein [Symploca sp. SIO1A3]
MSNDQFYRWVIYLLLGLTTLLTSCTTNVTDNQPVTTEEIPNTTEEIPKNTQFTCELINGQYTVMYTPEGQSVYTSDWLTLKPEASDFFGDAWSPQKRCQTISQRLELYRHDGFLQLRASTENGYDIVCMTTEQNPNCRIVFTLAPSEDAVLMVEQIVENHNTSYWLANMALFSVIMAFMIELNNSD